MGLRPFKKAAAECDFAPEGTSTDLHLGVLFLFSILSKRFARCGSDWRET